MKMHKTALVALALSLFGVIAPNAGATGGQPEDLTGCQNIGYLEICPRFRLTCFTPETKILMGDQKTVKPIHRIAYGEKIWNPVRKQAVPVKNLTAGPEKIPMLEIGYGDHVVHVTQGHPMVVQFGNAYTMTKAALRGELDTPKGYQLKKARDITLDDNILGADGQYHRVTKLSLLPLKADQSVWNIVIDTNSDDPADHMIVAEGIVTADAKIQAKMALE